MSIRFLRTLLVLELPCRRLQLPGRCGTSGNFRPTPPLLATFVISMLASTNVASANDSFAREIQLIGELLNLTSGDRVADLGAGRGEYAIAVADVVGESGVVVATELPDDLAELRDRLRDADLPQLRTAQAEYSSTGLAQASVDAAYLRYVFHHVGHGSGSERKAFAEDLFATIRPGGRLLLIEFTPTFLLLGNGVEPETLVEELSAVGFLPLDTVSPWPSSNIILDAYGMSFERPITPESDTH